jgi:putative ABC transport system permease protein
MMTGFTQDVRYALRQLTKAPGFAAVAVITLALGIGANTAIFSLLDQALLRSLPVKETDRLVVLQSTGSFGGQTSSRTDENFYFSYPLYRDLRDHNSVFSGLIATVWTQVGVQWRNQPELVAAELVSGNYFDMLGVQPALGRLLAASDDVVPDANPVVVLSFSYWKRRFGADPTIVSQSILVNGLPFTILGVAPPGFHSVVMGDTPDLFTPMTMKAKVKPGFKDLEDRRSRWLNIVGKLKPGLSRDQAEVGINPLWYSIRADELKQRGHSSEHFKESFLTQSHLFVREGAKGFSPLRHDVEEPLLVIMAMVGLVALMACANVGSLLLVRAAGRVREMSVRYALGAKRIRVVQQLLVEGLLLGLAGGALGIAIAPRVSAWLINMIWSATTGDLPFSSHPDLRILLFNFSLALLVSLLFSLAPAAQFWRPNLAPALKQQVMTAGGGPLRFRRVSVAVQIGLSLLVLVGAGLFVRTLHNLKSLPVGFATDHLVTFGVQPTLAGYRPDQTRHVGKQVLETLARLPGVRSVAGTTDPELANDNTSNNITLAGYTAKENENMNVESPNVSPGYFSTMGMALLAGREFGDQDRDGTRKVAVVNESFARHYFGEPRQAVGHYYGKGAGQVAIDTEIVGVVKDAKHTGVRDDIVQTAFTPYLQEPNLGAMTFYVRTWQSPESAEATIRRAMQTLDSKLVLDHFRTMQEQIDDNLTAERVIAILASSFGLLAVLMAAVGLYGVLAYSTAQRTREIGIRIALGAPQQNVRQMFVRQGLMLTGIGITCGVAAAVALTRLMTALLFEVSPFDPATYCAVCGVLLMAASLASYIPARRATNIDPSDALRVE